MRTSARTNIYYSRPAQNCVEFRNNYARVRDMSNKGRHFKCDPLQIAINLLQSCCGVMVITSSFAVKSEYLKVNQSTKRARARERVKRGFKA